MGFTKAFHGEGLSLKNISKLDKLLIWKALVKGERFIQPEKKPEYERPSKEIKVFTGNFWSY